MKLPSDIKYVIGIDEAGRGPLAGPVAVGVCLVPAGMKRAELMRHARKSGIKKLFDSKKLSEKMREAWLVQMIKMQKAGLICFAVTLISNKIIDQRGLSFAIKKAMSDSLQKLEQATRLQPAQCHVRLDGGLRAPAVFPFQKTIIKGDEKEFAISLASIAAKVTRDAHMKKMAKKYPEYHFEVHKGYGTARHVKAIRKEGIAPIHRLSFLKNILVK